MDGIQAYFRLIRTKEWHGNAVLDISGKLQFTTEPAGRGVAHIAQADFPLLASMIYKQKIHRWPPRLSAGTRLSTPVDLARRKNGCANVDTNGLLKFAKEPMKEEDAQGAQEK
jgi:hypothetical protein